LTALKPTPLPSNPTLADRIEYALQWLTGWMIINIPDHPCISGACSGAIMGGLGVLCLFVALALSGYFAK
jgi:hypothetical protein